MAHFTSMMFQKRLNSFPLLGQKSSGQSAGRNPNASGTGSPGALHLFMLIFAGKYRDVP